MLMGKWKRLVLIGGLATAAMAFGQAWELVYETDFASDPGWVTNNPARFHWEVTETFYSEQIDASEDYCYVPLPGLAPGRSWRVEYDIYPIGYTWAGNGRVSLTDA